jgi:hypothetical protein
MVDEHSGSKTDDEDKNTRIARHILAALRAVGVEAQLVENIDHAPPIIPDPPGSRAVRRG